MKRRGFAAALAALAIPFWRTPRNLWAQARVEMQVRRIGLAITQVYLSRHKKPNELFRPFEDENPFLRALRKK